MLIAVNYHYVRPHFNFPHPGVVGTTPSQLDRQLQLLETLGDFVSAQQVLDGVRGNGALPERSILITFDDGLQEQYRHAWPVLQRRGVPAIFFVNTWPILTQRVLNVHKIQLLRSHLAPREFADLLRSVAVEQHVELALPTGSREPHLQYLYDEPEDAQLKYMLNFMLSPAERDRVLAACFEQVFPGQEAAISQGLYMDIGQVRELTHEAAVGSHSHQHLPLGQLRPAAAREEIELASHYLQEWTGVWPYAMSYPYGSRNACPPCVGTWAAEGGIEFAFTMERAANLHLQRPLLLSRFGCNDVPGGKAYHGRPEDFLACISAAT